VKWVYEGSKVSVNALERLTVVGNASERVVELKNGREVGEWAVEVGNGRYGSEMGVGVQKRVQKFEIG
jgi:hypothetical protein